VQILGVLTETGQMRELPKSLDFEAGGGGFCGTIRLGNRQGHTMAVEVIPGSALVVVREEEP